ncbi:MAG: hypothetical protein JNJ40_02730 [Bacteroidia bacterium]|nr:hypothetical protein [Bacteroidia bacterium]
MKKIILSTLVLAALATTSCRKDRTCTCDYTTTSGSFSVTSKNVSTVSKQTKRVARVQTGCVNSVETQTNNNVTTTFESKCELK